MSDPPESSSPVSRQPGSLAKGLRIAFGIVAIVCFVWVLRPLVADTRGIIESVDPAALVVAIVLGVIGYALVCVPLALAWWWLSGVYGFRPSALAGYVVFAKSQWAKYLPTNTLQYVSRQALGREAGLSHAALGASALLEMASLVAAATLIAALGGSRATELGAARGVFLAGGVAAAIGIVSWPLIDGLARRLPKVSRLFEGLPHLRFGENLRILGISFVLHLVFFLGASVLLIALYAAGWQRELVPLLGLAWAFPVAWAAGTFAPGAPSGLGVREAVLLLALEPSLGASHAAALGIVFRLTTTGGDALTALAGWILARTSVGASAPTPERS